GSSIVEREPCRPTWDGGRDLCRHRRLLHPGRRLTSRGARIGKIVLPMQLADSHIHVFKPTFAEVTGRANVLKSELTTYEAYRKTHDIVASLIVGFEGIEAYKGNNAEIAGLAKKRPWMKPLAFHPCNGMTAAWVGERFDEGHVGVSIYCE